VARQRGHQHPDFTDRHADVRTVTLDDNFRSSKGIVALGQAIAEGNTGTRLDKYMVTAGHQHYDRGDILALSFDSPDAEARWICDRIKRLRGTSFQDRPDTEARGRSWSDFAVLYRSVSKDADPLVQELKRRSIPYVIKGLTRLFEAPEIQACTTCFRYIMQQVPAANVVDAWLAADLSLNKDDLTRALAVLDEARNWKANEHWSTYNIQRTYLRFLEELRIREERIPSAQGTARGELAFYNLGKFSQVISDFEQIHFQSQPQTKYTAFVKWLEHQAPDYYAESDADVGYATPDAVTIATVHQAQRHAVAGGIRPRAAQEPVPSQPAGWAQRVSRDSRRGSA
jgi:DNA helicase II / ATP-dependent DNA helicase PcrA